MTASKTTRDPKGNEVEVGADFIAFENSDEEESQAEETTAPQAESSRKRRRPQDEAASSRDMDPIGDSPPDCPWMGRHNYSRMDSVPQMLTLELMDFVDYISPTEEEHKVREFVVSRIRDAVKKLWEDVDVVVFGSFETKIYLPTSDLDMVVLRNQEFTGDYLNRLARHLQVSSVANEVQVISKAKVPIIKFKESISDIAVDISFNIENGIHSGQAISEFIRETPAVRPLTMLIKYFLMVKNYNEVYQGGLGSYTTVLMIVNFLQMHPQVSSKRINPMHNLGVLLIEFFELYGICFNYAKVGITVQNGGGYFPKGPSTHQPIYRRRVSEHEITLACIDPNDPSNDTARSSYAMQKIREVFVGAYGALTKAVQEHGRERFAAGSRTSSEASLIKDVFPVPKFVIEHRKKVAKIYKNKIFPGVLE